VRARFWNRANDDEGPDPLGQALDSAHKVAVVEGGAARTVIAGSLTALNDATAETEGLISRFRGKGEAFDRARGHLRGLANQLAGGAHSRLAEADVRVGLLQAQAQHFSVALFGRTMAGKSTVREALTRGDGSTIGKGAQNTTRKTGEYWWHRLRVLDAPGIATADDDLRAHLDQEARSAFARADLVLFMLSSDGIQQEVFRGLAEIRDRAKPVVFVLNYKLDLTKAVYRRRFIKHGGLESPKVRDAIRGHEARLRRFAVAELGMPERDVRVIPVHAQAAFLGRHASTGDERELLELSRIEAVSGALVDHVVEKGTLRRAQTMLDAASFEVAGVVELMRNEAREVRRKGRYTKDKFAELDGWLDEFIDARNTRALSDAKAMVAPLRRSVSSFVDDNIERRDVAKRWKRLVDGHGLPGKVDAWRASAAAELTQHLEEFARQIDLESSLDLKAGPGPSQYDPWDVKRGLGWVSAGSMAVTSVLLTGAALNWWNPAGWVMGALAGVSIAAGLLSWFSSSREEKLAKRRAEAAGQLRDSVDDIAASIAKQMKSWFYDSITRGVVQPLRAETKTMCHGMDSIGRQLFKLSHKLSDQVDELDRRLLTVALESTGENTKVIRAARQPGAASKVLVESVPDRRAVADAGRALGERIDTVLDAEPRHMVVGALEPARVWPDDVQLLKRQYLVHVDKAEIGRAIGRKGINVRLAGRLVQQPIKVVERRGGRR
jgi:transcription antitermination factor NusA-like protein/predicted GTPase